MGLIDDLGRGRVGVDTAIFIYFIEAAPRWLPIITPLFQAADTGRIELVTSAVTLLEMLVIPYRANDAALAARYEALLTRSRGIHLMDLTRDLLRRAAQLRARIGVRTPDALQIAAAQHAGCSTYVTNDRRLPPVPGLRLVQLAQYTA
ncbi:MAG TPA: PIN domain-containing protein [Acetobacteraceae bacterium]|jgi:predicted nucleic acid-binding protein|nr:PIN domain-containing protein [Acetobacteraceae bacterium]